LTLQASFSNAHVTEEQPFAIPVPALNTRMLKTPYRKHTALPVLPTVFCKAFYSFWQLCFMATVHLWITGTVQGVFYRATAAEKARALRLNGWIKNTLDGAVEATVSGSPEAVEQFVAWCRRGPANARVENVAVTPKPDDGFVGFQVIR
jgi:acylphosphatase